jgi:prepilin-type N-terminal cleavage/methylation domain-containing protein
MKNKFKKYTGFSLIELSLSIAILGIIIAGGMQLSTTQSGEEKTVELYTKLDKIEKALIVYLRDRGHLPCPARRSDAPDSSTFGQSTNCTITAVSGVEDISNVRHGVIPVRELNLSDSYMIDPWGNRFTYALIKDLGAESTAPHFINPSTSLISIRNAAGSDILSSSSDTAYVIISHGQAAHGASTKAGITTACSSSTSFIDKENCNGNNIFTHAPINLDRTNYYDDFIRWKSWKQARIESGVAHRAGYMVAQAPGGWDAGGYQSFSSSAKYNFPGVTFQNFGGMCSNCLLRVPPGKYALRVYLNAELETASGLSNTNMSIQILNSATSVPILSTSRRVDAETSSQLFTTGTLNTTQTISLVVLFSWNPETQYVSTVGPVPIVVEVFRISDAD